MFLHAALTPHLFSHVIAGSVDYSYDALQMFAAGYHQVQLEYFNGAASSGEKFPREYSTALQPMCPKV